jgi:hypothetical protein
MCPNRHIHLGQAAGQILAPPLPATNPSILNFSQDSDIFVVYQNLLKCTPGEFLLHRCTGFLIAKQISSLAQLGSMMSAAGHDVVIERIVQDWAFNPAQAEGLSMAMCHQCC